MDDLPPKSSSSSIPSDELARLVREAKLSREDLLAAVEPDDEVRARWKEGASVLARLFLSRLEFGFDDDEELLVAASALRAQEFEVPIGADEIVGIPCRYRLIHVALLHDLSDHGRSDLLRLGRDPDADLVPWVDREEERTDAAVSRHHGLVTVHDGRIHYIDHGAELSIAPDSSESQFPGSLNGTWIEDRERIDEYIEWPAKQKLTLGIPYQRLDRDGQIEPRPLRRFRLRYQLL